MIFLKILIPVISSICYRLGGADRTITPIANKWWRWGMGVPIAIITWNWWYVLTYYIATSVFVYGDNSWVSKLVGRKGARIVHGLAFGLASLEPLYAIWTAVIFYILFEMAESGAIDNKWAEAGRGFFGTLLFAFK